MGRDGGSMERGGRATARALVASFAAVAVAFTVGLAGAQRFIVEIRSAAREITGNSSPSIKSLSAMRSTLRQLEVAVDEHVATCPEARCGPIPARVERLEEELPAEWQRYRLLPTFPGEPDLWPRVDAGLAGLQQALALALDAGAAGRTREARDRVRLEVNPAFDRLDAGIAEIIEGDHAQGLALAGRIEDLSRLSTTASVILALLTVGLTILAATLAVQVVRRYERAVSERAEDLDQFAGRVAHDVKGPLAAAAAAFHVLRKGSPGAREHAIARGERSLERVQRLVDDLLEFARAGAVAAGGAADVRAVVEEVVGELRPVAEDHQVDVRVEAIADERVACSPGVLTSIVSNLVRNAITHMGRSEVRVVCVRAPAVGTGAPVRIEVEDTGPGMPGELGDLVFEPFVRGAGAGVAGTGLGLATVKRFVSAHGGRLGYRARPGEGTLFWLEMPPQPSPAGEPAPG